MSTGKKMTEAPVYLPKVLKTHAIYSYRIPILSMLLGPLYRLFLPVSAIPAKDVKFFWPRDIVIGVKENGKLQAYISFSKKIMITE